MLLHPADNFSERFMWRSGTRCEAASVARLTLLVAGKRALIFDIGANCGVFTLPLATVAGLDSRIVAFEPNPIMADRLRKNLELNHLSDIVDIIEVAVGNCCDAGYLRLVERNYGQASVVSVESDDTMPINVRPLVQYLPEDCAQYQVFVVKIDVEGFEDKVLIPFFEACSCERIPDVILAETHHAKLWSENVVSFLKRKGYIALFEGEDQNTLFVRGELSIASDN